MVCFDMCLRHVLRRVLGHVLRYVLRHVRRRVLRYVLRGGSHPEKPDYAFSKLSKLQFIALEETPILFSAKYASLLSAKYSQPCYANQRFVVFVVVVRLHFVACASLVLWGCLFSKKKRRASVFRTAGSSGETFGRCKFVAEKSKVVKSLFKNNSAGVSGEERP